MYKNFLSLFVGLIISIQVSGKSLINNSDCIIGNSTDPSPIIKVRPIGEGCYSSCQQYCAQKFKIDVGSFSKNTVSNKKNDMMLMKTNIMNINQDSIQDCVHSCFRGLTSNQKIRIPTKIDSSTGMILDDDGKTPYQWKCNIYSEAEDINDLSCEKPSITSGAATTGVCTQSDLASSYVDGNVRLVDGSTMLIKLADGGNIVDQNTYDDFTKVNENDIYLCGFKSVIYSPKYVNVDGTFIGDDAVSGFDPRIHTMLNPLGTGIFIKKNDYISINYYGRYYSNCNSSHSCVRNNNDFQLGLLTGGDVWQLIVPELSINDQSDETRREVGKNCEICITNQNSPICYTDDCKHKNYTAKTNQLVGSVTWMNNPKLFTQPLSSGDAESQFRSTFLSGNIAKPFLPQELKIYYPAFNTSNQSKGGYFVSLSWKGCRYQNGERLQYIIVNDAILNSDNFNLYMINDANWKPLIMNDVGGVYSVNVNITSDDLAIPSTFSNDNAVSSTNTNQGKIFFRINPLSENEASTLGVQMYGRENALGQYYLKIEPAPNKSIPSKIVDMFYQLLKDVSSSIFKGFQTNNEYLTIIRLVLVLYIALTGLMFMTGIAKITQNEAVVRIFKISVVIMLLSPNSYTFFNENFFKIFSFDNMNFLANLFTPEIDISFSKDLQTNTSACFNNSEIKVSLICVLENDLKMFFSWAFWNRIIGMLISGLFLPAVAIIAGVFMYAIIILKVTFLFCIAMLVLTVTISLAPIFIPLILFKYTKSFFDSWVKQLIATILQPIFIFTAISLFRAMFLILMQSAIGIAACKMCWIEFALPFGTYCLFDLYFYVPLSLSSSPDAFSLPIANIGVFISMFFVGHAMYTFCDFASKMAKELISYGLFDIGETEAGSPQKIISDLKGFSKPVYNVVTAPLDLLAIDDESRKLRKQFRKQRRDKQNDK